MPRGWQKGGWSLSGYLAAPLEVTTLIVLPRQGNKRLEKSCLVLVKQTDSILGTSAVALLRLSIGKTNRWATKADTDGHY